MSKPLVGAERMEQSGCLTANVGCKSYLPGSLMSFWVSCICVWKRPEEETYFTLGAGKSMRKAAPRSNGRMRPRK